MSEYVQESRLAGNAKHGMWKSAIFATWSNMIDRCCNPNHKHYQSYGGRGITICDEWRHDFQAFYDCVSKLEHYGEQGYTLDRIDNDLGYRPDNVRWATRKEQSRNTRRVRLLTYDGKTQCLTEWSEELGINVRTLSQRLRSGWDIDRAFTEPIDLSMKRR